MKLLFVAASLLCLGNAVSAEQVEIYLLDKLDGQVNGYCIDIKGGGQNINPADGLQAHTCYSYQGAVGSDQAFDSTKLNDLMLYMTEFDVCVTAADPSAGANLTLSECDGSVAQKIAFQDDGTIRPFAGQNLCITAGQETRSGRNPVHLIRDLTLEVCDANLGATQTWATRTELP